MPRPTKTPAKYQLRVTRTAIYDPDAGVVEYYLYDYK